MKAYNVSYRTGFHTEHVTVVAGSEAAAVKKAMAYAKRQGWMAPPKFVSLTVLPQLLP